MNNSEQNTRLLEAQNLTLEAIAKGDSLSTVLHKVIQTIEEFIPSSYCTILFINEAENTLVDGIGPSLPPEYMKGTNGIKIDANEGSCGTAAYRKEMVTVEDIESDPLWENFRYLALSHGLKACWSKPLLTSNQQLLGTFALYYKVQKKPNRHELKLLEAFSYISVLAIERKKLDEKLNESDRQYRLMAENMSDFVGVLDRNGVYKYISPSHQKYLGYSPEDLLGTSWLSYTHPNDFQNTRKKFAELVNRNKTQEIEFRFKHKQGYWVYLAFKGAPIHKKNGEINDYVYVARNITPRKQVEQKLKETSDFMQTLIHSSPLGIVALDQDDKVKLWNPAAEKISNWKKSDVLGKRYPLLFNKKSEEDQDNWLRKTVQNGKIVLNQEVKRQKKMES